jgi:hypothetical protein
MCVMRYIAQECGWFRGNAFEGWSGSSAKNIFRGDLKSVQDAGFDNSPVGYASAQQEFTLFNKRDIDQLTMIPAYPTTCS